MILKQFYLNCLAHASYLVGDESTHAAAVVDPQRDIDQYLAFASEHGLEIRHVFLTHFHADFIAGHLELRNRTGATVYLGAAAKAEYAFHALRDGDVVELGRVRLQALATPGHTPESISLLVFDLNRSGTEPHAVLTGDTLFIGDVGRPDLRAALGWSAVDLGGLLYESLRTKLLPLPDQSLVFPAHGAGSLCGKAISRETVSTIGEQRRSNYALQPMSKETFIDLVTADQPDAPPYFTYDAVLNGGQYATWAGTVLSRERPIVIIAVPGRESEAAMRLGRIGFDHVAGYLQHGLESLETRPELMRTTDRLSAELAATRLASSDAPVVVDVRTPAERAAAHIPNSLHIPLSRLMERVSELPRDRRLLVHCAGGYRSSIAASLLQREGFADVGEIAGGITAWEAAQLPVTREP
jgi:hydroxyacylglutathione hydrolase